MSQENVALIRHVYAEFDRRGELPWDLVSDEAVFDASDVMPDFAQPMRGKASVKPAFAAYVETFEEFHIELEAVLAFDDRHVVTTALDGGRMQGSPAEIRNRFHHAWTVADGLIVRWSSHLTADQAFEAVGLSE